MNGIPIDVARVTGIDPKHQGKVKLILPSDKGLKVDTYKSPPEKGPEKTAPLNVAIYEFPPPNGPQKTASGKNITWLAHFDVLKNNKKDPKDKPKYQIQLIGKDYFVFWDGKNLHEDLSKKDWKDVEDGKLSPELEGDPAIGMGT